MDQPVRKVKREIPQDDIQNEIPQTIIGKTMQDSTEQLLAFVNNKIQLTDHKLLFDGSREPSLYELNKAIAEYEHALLSLIVVYETAAWELEIAKESYEEFLNDKIVETRDTYNKSDIKRNTWLSASEIEAYAKHKYKDELSKLKVVVKIAERQKSTMLRILDGWNSYNFQLSQLSKNSIAEVSASIKSANAIEALDN
jgi:predicted ester cyclase